MISDFIFERAPPAAHERFRSIMVQAKARGAILVKDHRSKGVTMEPCSDWLADALSRCGIRVQRLTCPSLWASRKRIQEVVFCFCNLWAMSPKTRDFLRVKAGPWVALQTEHKGFRVYERPKCNYRWFLRQCDQVWDFGFDFCEGSSSIFLPTMWHPLCMMPSTPPRKTLDVVLLGQEDESRRYVRRALSRDKSLTVRFSNNLTPGASMGMYRAARIGLMIPRQAGNFEFHRFSAYAVSYTHIVALASPKMDSGLAKLLSPMVDFVDSCEAMVTHLMELLRDREALDAKIRAGHAWFASQGLPLLLKHLLEYSSKSGDDGATRDQNLVLFENAIKDAKAGKLARNLQSPNQPGGKIKNKMMRLMDKLQS